MRLTSFFVRNYQLTLVIVLMILAVSFITVMKMPRAEDPSMNPPQFPIVIIYPGTSPQDMEELVIKPIERKISELDDIKEIRTDINDGVAVMVVKYKYESDVEDKYQELVREMNALRSLLPQDLYKVEVRRITPSDVNVLQVALVSENASTMLLRTKAKALKEELEKDKSLKKVEYWGVEDPIVRINLHLDKLAEAKIPITHVLGNIQSEAANIPAGSVRAGEKVFNVKTSGQYQSVEEIRQTVISSSNGNIVRLEDVSDVQLVDAEQKHIVRLNGFRAVLVTAAQKDGENIAETQKRYLKIVDDFEKSLPSNIALIRSFDQAKNVNKRLSALGWDFLIAIGLVLFTLLPLGYRASLVVMVSIPTSLGLGVIALDAMGFSLNQLSIVGFVLALGLLVDDSIVVVENIERWIREGHSKRKAAIEATKQITLAVIGCTATLIIAFLPIAFLPEASGEFIRSLPFAVINAILASMLVSLTIVPFLASRFLKTEHDPRGNIFMRGLKKLISGSYSRLLDKALQRPKTTLLAALGLFVLSIFIFPIIGFRIFPTSEKPQFLVNVQMPLQSNIEHTNTIVKQVEKVLADEKKIEYYTTNVGKGNPRIYYNVIPENEKSDYAQIFIQLKESVKANEKEKIIVDLRDKFTKFSGAKIEIKNFEQGPPIEAPIAIRIIGDNLDTLQSLAGRAEEMLRKMEGTIYVNNEVSIRKSDLRVKVNTDKSRSLGILTSDLDKTIRLAVSGVEVGQYTDEKGDDYAIMVNAPRDKYATTDILKDIYINNAIGTPIALDQVADIQFETSPTSIKHVNKERFVVVTAFTKENILADDIYKKFLADSASLKLPTGYSIKLAGEVESREEAFGGNFTTIIIAFVFLFIMVLLLEFKTFKSTLIVLSVIPLGIIGGVLMLWLTGNPLSFVAIVGFIALAGIEVKNSILLVDFTNQLREQGVPMDEAIREAGEIRFLPIVLTSLTAIGGLTPIALNSNPLISPLAIVLIGGLITSTLLSRIVTPVVYKLIPPSIDKD
ncbi:MAG: efflux RND transporter permease subunit [Sphingobacteriales bacterium]|jgi:multidrug efflux pump subunit AcrB